MRVVFFVGTLQAGGLERFVTRISLKVIAENQFIPVVVCLNKRTGIFLSELLAANVEVYEAPSRWFRSPYRWWQFVLLLKRLKPDLVHSQVNFSMLQQFLASRMAGVRFTVTERNCYQRSGWALLRRRFQFQFLKFCNVQYSANSQRVAEHLSVMFRERPERFTVLPNGIEASMNNPLSTIDSANGSRTRILYVARMASHKGHLFFLEILENLIYFRSLPCEAILVGDGPLREEIEQTINRKNLQTFTTLLGIITNVDSYVQTADIVALLSDFEGMPNVVIEAMAAGKPVIATDVGNTRELFSTGAGVIIEKKEVTYAADIFESLILDVRRRHVMGSVGKQLIQQKFSLDESLAKLVLYYKVILNA